MAKTKAPRPKRTPRSAKKTTTATKTSSTKKPSPKKQRAADFDGDALYERSIAKSLEAERKSSKGNELRRQEEGRAALGRTRRNGPDGPVWIRRVERSG